METDKMRMLRIVVTGPESTGKSTLCRELAKHFQTRWVPEYARAYLEEKGPAYTEEDLWLIAQGQMRSEKEITASIPVSNSPGLVFVDTDLHVIRIWGEYVFGSCDNRVLKHIAEQACDLYLLCDTDLPWTPDPLREYPDSKERRHIFQYYLDTMINQPAPWVLISGGEAQRLQAAIHAVDAILRQS